MPESLEQGIDAFANFATSSHSVLVLSEPMYKKGQRKSNQFQC
jgi:hypothetical protein